MDELAHIMLPTALFSRLAWYLLLVAVACMLGSIAPATILRAPWTDSIPHEGFQTVAVYKLFAESTERLT
jgi:hypothetical protein